MSNFHNRIMNIGKSADSKWWLSSYAEGHKDARHAAAEIAAEADAILATQAAEIERLRDMTRNQAQEYLALDMQATEALARATAAEAEAARLRDALKVYSEAGCDKDDNTQCEYEPHLCCQTARAALAERKP